MQSNKEKHIVSSKIKLTTESIFIEVGSQVFQLVTLILYD